MTQETTPGKALTLLSDETAAQLLWDEYKFRQEHYWRSLHRFTFAIITLCVIPFLYAETIAPLGEYVGRLLLGLAITLSVATSWILNAEYLRLNEVRRCYDRVLGDRGPSRKPKGCLLSIFWGRIGFVTSFVYFVGFLGVSILSFCVYVCSVSR